MNDSDRHDTPEFTGLDLPEPDPSEKKRLGKAEPQKSSMTGVTVTGTCKPKSSCKKCYGRGYVGRDTETGGFVNCTCIFRKVEDMTPKQPAAPAPQHTNMLSLDERAHNFRHDMTPKDEPETPE